MVSDSISLPPKKDLCELGVGDDAACFLALAPTGRTVGLMSVSSKFDLPIIKSNFKTKQVNFLQKPPQQPQQQQQQQQFQRPPLIPSKHNSALSLADDIRVHDNDNDTIALRPRADGFAAMTCFRFMIHFRNTASGGKAPLSVVV